MSKLWNRILSQQGGAQQTSLLKKNGPTSDGFQDKDDDDSSSLSGRREGSSTNNKKKFVSARRLFRRKTAVGGDDEGYGKAKWRAFLSGKTVVQRREDGSELPVESNVSSKWPIFNQIYKRQNQLLKKGEAGEDGKGVSSDDEDDDDSDFSTDSPQKDVVSDPVLAPPAPRFDLLSLDTDVLNETLADQSSPENNCRSSPVSTQESGISTCERSEECNGRSARVIAPVKTRSSESSASSRAYIVPSYTETTCSVSTSSFEYPIQASTHSDYTAEKSNDSQIIQSLEKSKDDNTGSAKGKGPLKKSKHSKPTVTKRTGDILTPLSIPLTICYSLRSAIGDGSARQRNSHSLMERRSLRPNGSHLDISHWSHRGKRSYMEDRFVIEHIGTTSRSKDGSPITWLAVFDGHGGASASQFCSDWLSSYVRKNDFFPKQLPLAMQTAFTKIDSDFVSSGNLDGSTACACAVIGYEKVICCNAGDSRAIIVKRDGSVVALSEDHKPGRNDETKRINDLGGRVIYWGRWRVEGVLAVSRSIGDAKLKPYVTAEPDIVEHNIGEDDMFLVIASDGVWDTMTSDLVAKFVLVNT
eukprot:CCRYP_003261-RA/>CCRYP_003261-RA protein AED:0.32 eAED:0.32 QI:0/0.83/0.71/1/1/0.85/7/661/583